MEKELPKRKHPRLDNFDYSTAGAYFITICTQNRRQILSKIAVGRDVPDAPLSDVPDAPKIDVFDASQGVNLLPYGIVADKFINQLNAFYDNIYIDNYVIMPNHIHIILFVKSFENGASRTSRPTTKQHSIVSQFVSTFKRFCNKEIGENIWQTSFHDHVIRNRDDYEEHKKYIYENPMRWYYDELYTVGRDVPDAPQSDVLDAP